MAFEYEIPDTQTSELTSYTKDDITKEIRKINYCYRFYSLRNINLGNVGKNVGSIIFYMNTTENNFKFKSKRLLLNSKIFGLSWHFFCQTILHQAVFFAPKRVKFLHFVS